MIQFIRPYRVRVCNERIGWYLVLGITLVLTITCQVGLIRITAKRLIVMDAAHNLQVVVSALSDAFTTESQSSGFGVDDIESYNWILQPHLDKIHRYFPESAMGIYLKKVNSVVAVQPKSPLGPLPETVPYLKVLVTGQPLSGTTEQPQLSGDSMATYQVYPLIQNGEIVGLAWAALESDFLAKIMTEATGLSIVTGTLLGCILIIVCYLIYKRIHQRLRWHMDKAIDGSLDRKQVTYPEFHSLLDTIERYKATVLQEAESRVLAQKELERLYELSPEIIAVINLDHILKINPAVEPILGYTQTEIQAFSYLDLIHPDDLANVVAQMRGAFNGPSTTLKNVARVRSKHGIYRWLDCQAVFDAELHHFYLIARDVTEQKIDQANLARTAAIVTSSSAAIIGLDPDLKIDNWNASAAAIYGYSDAEVLGSPLSLLAPPELRTELQQLGARVLTGESVGELETQGLRRDGSLVDVAATYSPIRSSSGEITGIAVIHHDITNQVVAKQALLASQERFSKAFHDSPVLKTISTIKDDIFLDVNEVFCRYTGYDREDVIGRSAAEIGIWADLTERTRVIQALEKGTITQIEVHLRSKNGEVRTYNLSASKIELGHEPCLLTSIIDITERKRMQEQISRLDRLNLVGQMAAGIGHEIRNPMTTVRGFLQLLGQKEEFQAHREYFELMISELDRANEIISEFLSLARNRPISMEIADLNHLVNAITPLIQADALLAGRDFVVELGEDINPILADDKEIRQLVLNLVRNGLEATPPGGKVTLSTCGQDGAVVLIVSDQGPGIPDDIYAKLGTPFVTTKEKGTGLGLAVCYSIADRHRATITVETGSQGTTFAVSFPPVLPKCLPAAGAQ